MESDKKIFSKDDLLAKIEKGAIKMRPRFYFALRAAGILIACILLAFMIIFLISFILFLMKAKNAWDLPGFGFKGIGVFILSFPWMVFIVISICIIALEITVNKLSFSYKRPLIYSGFTVLALACVSGFFVSRMPLHQVLMDRAIGNKLPFASPLYMRYGALPEGVFRAKILSTGDNGFVVEINGEKKNLILEGRTGSRLIKMKMALPGDEIIFGGECCDKSEIKAWGAKKIIRGQKFPARPSEKKNK